MDVVRFEVGVEGTCEGGVEDGSCQGGGESEEEGSLSHEVVSFATSNMNRATEV